MLDIAKGFVTALIAAVIIRMGVEGLFISVGL